MCRCIDILGMYMCNIHTRRMVIDWQFPHELSLALEPSFEDWRPSSHFTSGAQKYERWRSRTPTTKLNHLQLKPLIRITMYTRCTDV
jgi:hypothetical protein